MQKLLINAPEELLIKIDESIKRWGFASRSEFFRFAAIDFIRNDGRFMPADDTLKTHAKAILSVKAGQYLRGVQAG